MLVRFQRGLKRKPLALIKKLRKAKREAATGEKPEPVRTHLRDMIIVPEMIGSIIGVYNGKTFNQVRGPPVLNMLQCDMSSILGSEQACYIAVLASLPRLLTEHNRCSLSVYVSPPGVGPWKAKMLTIINRPVQVSKLLCRLRSSRTWWATTWQSSQSATSPSSTASPESVPLTPPASSL